MSHQSTTENMNQPRYALIHRNWRDYREADYTYTKFNLDGRNSRQIEAYHALAERLLATGDWITHEDREIPELLINQNPDLANTNSSVQLERIHANGIFTAEDYTYGLILMRHYFKNGELHEMSIILPIGKLEHGLSIVVHPTIETRGHKLALDEALIDLDAFIDKINALYKSQAASIDGQVYSIRIKHMPIDFDLLKRRFLLKRVDDKKIPFSNYDDLKVTSFGQSMFMNVSFMNDNVLYEYRVDSVYYLKLLNEHKQRFSETEQSIDAY